MITIQGKGVYTGVAAGPLYFYQRAKGTLTRYEVEDREAEFARFKEAQAKAIEQLGELAEKARKEAESARQNAVSAREKVDDYR